MSKALEQANKACEQGEVPIGAIITHKNKIIAQAHNQIEQLKDSTAHAEIIAITQASQTLGDWRLNKCYLFVTKEPCIMCLGAIANARIKKIFFGLEDKEFGGFQLCHKNKLFHHQFKVKKNILAEESHLILKKFFKEKRIN